MKHLLIIAIVFAFVSTDCYSQKIKQYTPSIQPCNCFFKMDSSYIANAPVQLRGDSIFPNRIDSSFKTQCGYLVVPENRKNPLSRMIRLPFIIVKSKNPNKKKDPVLFTSGGPGNSSLGWV